MNPPRHPPTRRAFVVASALTAAGFSTVARRTLRAADKNAPVTPERTRMHTILAEADRLLTTQTETGTVTAAAILVRRGAFEFARAYGKADLKTPFLIASPTKPMTASAVMLLRDRQQLQLTDTVTKHLPQFTGGERELVTLKHLLNHTSGLPDMLPENVELRKRHAPLSEFVAGTCRTPLLFRPGTKVNYQSMGILLAAAIVEQVSGKPLPEFLAANFFAPLKMTGTSLGLGGRQIAETARCQVPEPNDWDWNSPYWRNLGVPWGGAHSTVHDLAVFIEHFTSTGPGLLAEATRREMRSVQTAGLNQAWGLGWSLQPGAFGQTSSPATFGHFGSTGTVVWHDPAVALTCVLLTTQPAEDSHKGLLGPVSDIVARSVRG